MFFFFSFPSPWHYFTFSLHLLLKWEKKINKWNTDKLWNHQMLPEAQKGITHTSFISNSMSYFSKQTANLVVILSPISQMCKQRHMWRSGIRNGNRFARRDETGTAWRKGIVAEMTGTLLLPVTRSAISVGFYFDKTMFTARINQSWGVLSWS